MPIRMGPPVRVPYYAYPNWELNYVSEQAASDAYREEWANGTEAQLVLVSRATQEAGLGDYPQLLRQKAAEVTAKLLAHYDDAGLKILDIGSGPGLSASATYEALPSHLQKVTRMFLLEPSAQSMKKGVNVMENKGIKYTPLCGIDLDIPRMLKPNSLDAAVAVASIHHHAQIPFDTYHRALKPGGFLVIADWHQPIWEHPGSVLTFLKNFDWAKKRAGLRNWRETYKQAKKSPALPDNPQEREAIDAITLFWMAYAEISAKADLGPNAIWPLEGHRPVQRYIEGLQAARFSLDTPDIQRAMNGGKIISANPHQVLENSTLLQVTVAQKV